MITDKIILVKRHGGIGEVVNTIDCDSIMRGFEPHVPPHYAIYLNVSS